MVQRQLARLAMAGGVLLGLSGFGAIGAQAQMAGVTFGLHPQNNSNLHGTVTLVPMGAQTKVTIQLTLMNGAPAMGMPAMPAHIHQGTCANLNPTPLYPLANVVDGRSETVINANFEANMGKELAVNIHKSAQEVATYVACGDLARANAMAMPGMAMPGAAAMPAQGAMPAPGAMAPAPGAMAGQRPMTQMPGGMMAGGAMMPATMPKTGEAPILPIALLGVGVVGAGVLLRRRR